MITKLRPLIILLALAGVLVGIWAVVVDDLTRPEVEQATAAGGWEAEFEGRGAATDYLVHVTVEGTTDPDDVLRQGFTLLDCSVVGSGLECRGHATVANDAVTLSLAPGAPGVSLTVDDLDTVRQTRQAPFDAQWLSRLFLLALAFVPIIVLTHRREALSQWLLIGFSVSVLMVLQWGFTLVLLAILLGFFAIGRWYRGSDRRSSRFILNWLAVTALLLLVLKNFKAIFLVSFEDYGALALVLPLGTSYFLIRLLDLQLRWHRGQLEHSS